MNEELKNELTDNNLSIELKNVLIDNNVLIEEDKLIEDEIKVKKLTYLKIRDAIWKVGRVVAELEEEDIYVASIKSGKIGNTAYLALKYLPGRVEIVGYAKEGLINWHTTEKAIKNTSDPTNFELHIYPKIPHLQN